MLQAVLHFLDRLDILDLVNVIFSRVCVFTYFLELYMKSREVQVSPVNNIVSNIDIMCSNLGTYFVRNECGQCFHVAEYQ